MRNFDGRRQGIRPWLYFASAFLILCGAAERPDSLQIAATVLGFALILVPV
jgi:hypothetical protein